MKQIFLTGTALPLLGAIAVLTSAPALAQEQGVANDDGGIAEIVVTAQKRSENVQSVPIAISAFAGDALSERSVGNVSQLASLSPNVNLDSGVSFSASTAVLAASIRGIGASDFAFNIDPAVGVYIDGVYLARSVGANQDLLDVERIEILKGPQGTLFGRNTIGGAVSIVTRDPGKEFSVRGDLTVGRFDLFQARASIDLPLAENLYSLFTLDVKSRSGYMKRLPFPGLLTAHSPSYSVYPAAAKRSAILTAFARRRTVGGSRINGVRPFFIDRNDITAGQANRSHRQSYSQSFNGVQHDFSFLLHRARARDANMRDGERWCQRSSRSIAIRYHGFD